MSPEKNTWGEYSNLVLKELERLNENYERMRTDLNELNQKLTEVKSIETTVKSQKEWIDKVTDVWSPSQMQSAKDEIYKQKNRWTATLAIITFTQILIGLLLGFWGKF